MGNCWAGLASVDSYGVDSSLNTNRNLYLLPLGPLAPFSQLQKQPPAGQNKRQH